MKYLLILDAALFALAVTLAVVLAVVLLMYSVYAETSASVAAGIPTLATAMTAFGVVAIPLGVAFWSLLRRKAWLWWAQAAAAVMLVLGSMFLFDLFTA